MSGMRPIGTVNKIYAVVWISIDSKYVICIGYVDHVLYSEII